MIKYRCVCSALFYYTFPYWGTSDGQEGKRVIKRRLGLLSDTHGHGEAWIKASVLWGDSLDAVLHAGDVLSPDVDTGLAGMIRSAPFPVIISRGNCDAPEDEKLLERPLLSPYVFVWWNGKSILMAHGDGVFEQFRSTALRGRVDLAVYGHTHVASVVREEGTLFVNPGSASLPKGRDPASAAIVDDDGIVIFTLDGVELHRERWDG